MKFPSINQGEPGNLVLLGSGAGPGIFEHEAWSVEHGAWSVEEQGKTRSGEAEKKRRKKSNGKGGVKKKSK